MTEDEKGAPTGADGIARTAALLKRYPEITGDELGSLKNWFAKEASALDIGTLASDPTISSGYARFRKEHIDKFGLRDIAILIVALAVVAGLIFWIVS